VVRGDFGCRAPERGLWRTAYVRTIMQRFALLPWWTETGSLPADGLVRAGRAGVLAWSGGWRPGGRCTVVLACRLPSLVTCGPFEAV